MSNGYRNGAFALGLVTGGGIVLNLVLWSAYRSNEAREAVAQNPENYEGHPWVRFWDWLATTFFTPSDTIAQWAMALLSLAAVYLLWETLKASRKTLLATQGMARDTREIGEAQILAHINLHLSLLTILKMPTETSALIQVVGTIRNDGVTVASALSCEIDATVSFADASEVHFVTANDDQSILGGDKLRVGGRFFSNTPNALLRDESWLTPECTQRFYTQDIKGIDVRSKVKFTDVFDREWVISTHYDCRIQRDIDHDGVGTFEIGFHVESQRREKKMRRPKREDGY